MKTFNDFLREYTEIFKGMSWLDAKTFWHKTSLKVHPDITGDNGDNMKALNAAWDSIKGKLASDHGKENNKREGYSSWATTMADGILSIALEIAKISPDLIVTIAGYWIWVEGDTKSHHQKINRTYTIKFKDGVDINIKARWHNEKKAWYVPCVKSSGTGKMSLGEIKETYGNQRITYTENSIM